MAKQETKKPFVMNLQLFSDSAPSPAEQALAMMQAANAEGGSIPEGAAPAQGQPQPTEGNPQSSPQEGGQMHQMGDNMPMNQPGQQPSQEGTQGQPQAAPSAQEQLWLGKFKSPDELANGYVNVEKAFSQKAQEASALQQQLQAAQQQMQQMQQQIQSVVNPQQQPAQPTPEEQAEQFMSQFYENPMEAIKGIIEQAVMPQIQPMQQHFQQQQQAQMRDQALNQFVQQTPDFEQFKPVMSEILTKSPELNQMEPTKALQIAYQMAKGQQYQDPNSLLQNQDFVKQNVLSNADIKNQIIQEYLQGLQKGNQAPTVISGQPGGQTTVVPENQPQTIKDARSFAEKYLRQ